MTDKTTVRLYSTEGLHLTDVEHDVCDQRPEAIHFGSRWFVWNQRNSQYREVEPMKATLADQPIGAPGVEQQENKPAAESNASSEAATQNQSREDDSASHRRGVRSE